MDSCYHYTIARSLFVTSGGFGERLNTGGANHHAFAADMGPLQVDVFAVAVDGVIIAAQEFAFISHH